jgi:hypothetical protein
MTSHPSPTRRLAGRLGLFAMLFQAILFGWHHHDLSFAGRSPVPVLVNPSGPPQAADDEDGCEICQVLHHLTAAPADVAAAPPPLTLAAASISGDSDYIARTPALAFRARAPPSLEAAIG